ncbi:MAG: Glycerol kinase [Firmicutes bacterium]|nr:Glycerol kinase [Bacillota bacterium]
MKKGYVLALDAGTIRNRAVIFDSESNIVSVAKKEIVSFHPKPGWVEQDAEEIWGTQLLAAQEAIEKSGLKKEDIVAIGITNQRETTVVWDKTTGRPIYNAISWQSRQTEDICRNLRKLGLEEEFRQKTSLIINSYFSGSKIRWILDHVPGAQEKAEAGQLLFGTMDTWIMWKLSGGRIFATDYSNASRTLLYNLRELKWDEDLLQYLNIPQCMLPKVCSSSEIYGYTDPSIFGMKTPIAGDAGNQQADLFGQGCFEPGMAKNTYGEGSFFLMNTGHKFCNSNNGLITTIAWGINGKITYALEGSVFVAGAAIQWLKSGLGILDTLAESEWLAKKVGDTGGVYFVPAFRGLSAPYWDMQTSGMIIGLKNDTTKSHIVRAALAAMAYQVRDVVEAIESDTKMQIQDLKVDGGASNNNLLVQFQADILGVPIKRSRIRETTALGAAYLAGLAVGVWKDTEELKSKWQEDTCFKPQIPEIEREEYYSGWQNAVSHVMRWVDKD